jgi:DivIVA domain-containing protein
VALDQAIITRKDFPIAKRGYDQAAVDAHLSALADAVAELEQERQPETMASAVSEQVRGIVQAAEKSAAEIVRSAELEAQEARAQASEASARATGETQRMRERVAAQARDYVSRLSSSITTMLERLEAMDRELNTLTTSLRHDTERLRGELNALEDELAGSVADETEATPVGRLEPVVADASDQQPVERQPVTPAPAPYQEPPTPTAQPTQFTEHPVASPDPTPAQYAPESSKLGDRPPEQSYSSSNETDDTEGARLIALNMALNGTPREETARYLVENYHLADPERLLDEVYSSVHD